MDIRFEEGPEEAMDIITELINNGTTDWQDLANAKILSVFDTKKKVDKEKIVLARIIKSTDFTRFLTQTEIESGYDYYLVIDKLLWTKAIETREEKVRLIRHELKHTSVNHEKANPYGLRGHSLEDFYSEVEANKDDPKWAERLGTVLSIKYEEEREQQKQLTFGGQDER
jgi:hypothetical protein